MRSLVRAGKRRGSNIGVQILERAVTAVFLVTDPQLELVELRPRGARDRRQRRRAQRARADREPPAVRQPQVAELDLAGSLQDDVLEIRIGGREQAQIAEVCARDVDAVVVALVEVADHEPAQRRRRSGAREHVAHQLVVLIARAMTADLELAQKPRGRVAKQLPQRVLALAAFVKAIDPRAPDEPTLPHQLDAGVRVSARCLVYSGPSKSSASSSSSRSSSAASSGVSATVRACCTAISAPRG